MNKKEYKKLWQEKNKNHIKEYSKLWYNKNKERKNNYDTKYMKNYYYKYREKNINRTKIYFSKKYKFDINFKILHNLRSRVRLALKGNPKLSTTIKLVNCSIKFLKQHLKNQFTKGMSFNNYGKWHIDHIRPCASFDLSKVSEQRKCFNYKNLQPLWAKDNISKGKKFI